LYDPLTMPPPLVKAHQQLDKAVDAAYVAAEKAAGRKAPKLGSDAERVAFLFERYQALTLAAAGCQGHAATAQGARRGLATIRQRTPAAAWAPSAIRSSSGFGASA
jgi:hypothetical protein